MGEGAASHLHHLEKARCYFLTVPAMGFPGHLNPDISLRDVAFFASSPRSGILAVFFCLERVLASLSTNSCREQDSSWKRGEKWCRDCLSLFPVEMFI